MVLSKKQEDAIEWIKRMEEHLGKRWFTRYEMVHLGISLDGINELVYNGYLEGRLFEGTLYYRFRGGI